MDLAQRKKEPNIYRKYWKYILAGVASLGVHIFLAYYVYSLHLDKINKAKYTIEFEENEKMNDGILSINQYLDMQSHEASFLAKQIKSLDTLEIEGFCKDFMKSNTEYIQLRILTEQGDETLRLIRKEGILTVVPKERFQNKAHRGYFKKAIEIDEFEVSHSELNLDIEYGKPLEPLRVTLRHYSPFIRNGEKYVAGLNWDYKKLFSVLDQRGLFLLNENQELLHGNIAERYKKTNIEELTTSLAKNFLLTSKSFEMFTGQRLTIGTKRELKEFNHYENSEKHSLYILWVGIFLGALGSLSVMYVFARKKNELESERKYIEEIRFNVERFDRWKASNFIGILQFNTREGIDDANDTLLKMLGYSRQDLIEGKLDWTKLTPHEFLHLDKKAMQEAEDKGFWTPFEKEYFHKDGHRVPVIVGGSIFMEAPDEYIVFIIDLTERKKMEETLLQSEKLRVMGMITSGIAHDFNNILAVISGVTQVLEMDNEDNKELMDGFRTIIKASDDGAEIVYRMSMFTRQEKGTSVLLPVDIRGVLEQAIDFVKPRWMNIAKACGIDYNIDDNGVMEVPIIMGNESELREVFINIMNNALDAMKEGGCLSFCTWQDEENILISISDTGEGMSEEVKKRVFEPFYTTKHEKGSGLGMSMSFGIIERHDGSIDVKSEVGKGTTFTLRLPIAVLPVQQIESSVEDNTIKAKGLSVLVVDDKEDICSILEMFFANDDHTVKTAESGNRAIEMLKTETFDLVICDLVMPEMSGHEVVAVLNKIEKRPKIGLMTGWSERLETEDKNQLNVDFIIKKPFKFSVLAGHINDAFECG